jgi:4-hydroxybenzoate polyprenyltransferase
MVLISGYMMRHDLKQPITILLSIPVGLFTIFFVTYAVCYDYDYSEQGPTYEYDQIAHREAIKYTSSFVVAFMVIGVLIYIIANGPMPTRRFLAFLLLITSLYLSYSLYLYKKCRLAGNPKIRHWLIWPVILSIATSLYYGQFFSVLNTSLEPHFPILILLIFFLVAEIIRFRKKQFLIASGVGSTALIILTILQGLGGFSLPPILGVYFPAMLFCMIMSAYLAVFEAWRMTAFIAVQESSGKPDTTTSQLEITSEAEAATASTGLTQRYYNATLLALTISVWFIPLAYIYSDYDAIFLACFTLHAIAAFAFWLIRVKNIKSLSEKDWSLPKNIFGTVFLIIMVVGVKVKTGVSLNTSVVTPLMGKLSAVMGAISGLWMFRISTEYEKLQQPTFLAKVMELYTKKVNVSRLVGIAAFAASFIIYFFDDFPAVAPYLNKAQQAYLCYVTIFLVCCIVEFFNITNLYRFSSSLLFMLLGILHTVRFPPSLLIGLSVLLPGLSVGVPIQKGILSAVPFCLIAMSGYALNDYFDIDKDKINKPYKPYPSGKLTRSHIFILAITLFLLSISFSYIGAKNNVELSFYLIALIGVAGYNLIVRYVGFLKAFYTAVFSSLPLLYDVVVYNLPQTYIFALTAALLFISAREMLMDIRDIPGDKQDAITTLPMILGEKATANAAFLMKVASLVFLLPFVVTQPLWLGLTIWLTMLLSTLFMYKMWWVNSGRYCRTIIRSLWVTIFMGITLIAL